MKSVHWVLLLALAPACANQENELRRQVSELRGQFIRLQNEHDLLSEQVAGLRAAEAPHAAAQAEANTESPTDRPENLPVVKLKPGEPTDPLPDNRPTLRAMGKRGSWKGLSPASGSNPGQAKEMGRQAP